MNSKNQNIWKYIASYVVKRLGGYLPDDIIRAYREGWHYGVRPEEGKGFNEWHRKRFGRRFDGKWEQS